jgi:hypothetical protein
MVASSKEALIHSSLQVTFIQLKDLRGVKLTRSPCPSDQELNTLVGSAGLAQSALHASCFDVTTNDQLIPCHWTMYRDREHSSS